LSEDLRSESRHPEGPGPDQAGPEAAHSLGSARPPEENTMLKKSLFITAVAMLALAAGCANQQGPATKPVGAAEAALAALKDDAARLLPGDLSGVETTLTGLKDSLAKGDYKAVLAAAPELSTRIAALRDATAAKKAEWEAATAAAKEKWTGFAADLPKMVDA